MARVPAEWLRWVHGADAVAGLPPVNRGVMDYL